MATPIPVPALAPARAFVAGHFGEWLQGRAGPAGPVALITLACPTKGGHVTVSGNGPFQLSGAAAADAHAARLCLEALGLRAQGQVRLSHDLPPGGGAGMSTATLIALARAAARAQGQPPPTAQALARGCLAAEGALDPLMLARPDAVLWASRQGRVIRPVPPPPHCEIIGGFFGPPLRTDPADLDFARIDDLLSGWDQAGGLADYAAIASESARRCTAQRGPAQDPTSALARDLGALGHARAHTGSARALIFAPGTAPPPTAEIQAALARAGLTGILRFHSGGPV